MSTDKIKLILLDLIDGVTTDGLAHITSFDSMKNRVDQARQAILDLVPGKRDIFGAAIDLHKAPNIGWNSFRDKLMENFGGLK